MHHAAGSLAKLGKEFKCPKEYSEVEYVKPSKGTVIPLSPKRKADETGLEYTCNAIYNQKWTNTDLREFKKHGYEIGKIIKAVEFTEKPKVTFGELNRELFDKRLIAKKEGNKIQADRYKLSMNGNYGKTLEKPIRHRTKILRSNATDDYKRMQEHATFIESLTQGKDKGNILNYHVMKDGSVVYEEKTINPINKNAPAQVGAEILSESKAIMNKLLDINPYAIHYMDTDSGYVKNKIIDIAKKRNLIGNDMGQFKNDYGEGKKCVYGLFAAAKCKCTVVSDMKNPWLSVSTTWKGVPLNMPANPAEKILLNNPRAKNNYEKISSFREYAIARKEMISKYERFINWEPVKMDTQILWKRGYEFGVTTTDDGKKMICKRERKQQDAQTVVIKCGPYKGIYENVLLPFGWEAPE
uniref:DNA-directed DNA polymerase n=1 Tax=Amphimedon queenslandica TaxID=400682 RepID=A0A1X7UML6_AMPQE